MSTNTPAAPPTESEASQAQSETSRPWALKQLPPFPAVALQLLNVLDDIDVPMKKIVDLLRMDPALSAEILRVANSALYGLRRRIDNMPHAVMILGSETVKRLALTVALGRFSHGFLHNQALRSCWDHSLATALIAEELAVQLGEPKDRAYTGALLADVGRLALLTCYPVEYGNLLVVARENEFDQLECERQLFDIDHCAAGEWLGRHWNLPSELVEVSAQHHSHAPSDASLLSIATVADQMADALGFAAMQIPAQHGVEELLAMLPITDQAGALEKFETFADKIRETTGTVSPTSDQ